MILWDLLLRLGHSETFYSDSGVLPRTLAIPLLNPNRWSLFFFNGSSEFVTAILVVGIFAAIMMMLGVRTRVATIVLWIVVVSVQARNAHVLSGADTLMRLSLFWAMFLPLGMRWSLDSRRTQVPDHAPSTPPISVSSFATFGIVFQTACLYLFTAIQKSGPRWHEEGTAVYYALGARDLSTSFGNWLFHSAPNLFFQISSFGTLVMEYAVPSLLLLPVRNGWMRGIAVAAVFALQLGIATTMTVGLFPAIAIASVVAVTPPGVWNFLEERLASRQVFVWMRKRWNRLLDGVLPREYPTAVDPAPAQADETTEPQIVGFVSRGRLSLRPGKSSMMNVVCAIAAVLILMWNVSTVSSYSVPEPASRVAVAAGLYQDWSMFAPSPQASTIWYVVEGTLSSGQTLDMLAVLAAGDLSKGETPVWDQSDELVVENKYWRKYLPAILDRDSDLLAFAGYACRTWNAEFSGQNRLESLTLTRAYAQTLPNSERAEPAYVSVGSWDCN